MRPVRRRNQTQYRLGVHDQRDIYRELAGSLNEFFGAIKGVNHPAHWPIPSADQLLEGRFLREYGDVRREPLQGAANQTMRGMVGLSNRTRIRLCVTATSLALA